jgi:PKHD-type hydroxylase
MILENYIWQAPEFFSPQEIADMHHAANKLQFMTGQIGASTGDKDAEDKGGDENLEIRSSQVKWFDIPSGQMPTHLYNKIISAVDMANADARWNHQWDYMENPQYTIYNEQPHRKGDFYTWHTDAGPIPYANGSHRKLSMSIQLNTADEYEGGHFQWLEPQREFDKMKTTAFGMEGLSPSIDMNESIRTLPFSMREIGSVIVFPSFLYHQVTPILSGTRKSLVAWFTGRPYV